MMALLFLLFAASVFFALFRMGTTSIILTYAALALCVAMFVYHVTDKINICF